MTLSSKSVLRAKVLKDLDKLQIRPRMSGLGKGEHDTSRSISWSSSVNTSAGEPDTLECVEVEMAGEAKSPVVAGVICFRLFATFGVMSERGTRGLRPRNRSFGDGRPSELFESQSSWRGVPGTMFSLSSSTKDGKRGGVF